MDITKVTIEGLVERLSQEHQATCSPAFPKGNWAAVGRKYNVSNTIVWRIVREGYEPQRPDIRSKLGLTEIIQQTVFRNAAGRFSKARTE